MEIPAPPYIHIHKSNGVVFCVDGEEVYVYCMDQDCRGGGKESARRRMILSQVCIMNVWKCVGNVCVEDLFDVCPLHVVNVNSLNKCSTSICLVFSMGGGVCSYGIPLCLTYHTDVFTLSLFYTTDLMCRFWTITREMGGIFITQPSKGMNSPYKTKKVYKNSTRGWRETG